MVKSRVSRWPRHAAAWLALADDRENQLCQLKDGTLVDTLRGFDHVEHEACEAAPRGLPDNFAARRESRNRA
jgi:hypothetical protein